MKKCLLCKRSNDTTNDKRWQIYLVNADGSNPRRLSQEAANNQVPNWSPDGRRILFTSIRSGQSEIYTVKPDGVGLTRLPGAAGR